MDEKYKKIFNKNMNNNNYFKYISKNVIQKNKESIVINQMSEQLFIVNFLYYIKNNHKIYEELLSKNYDIMKEKIFYLKKYILNTISSDLLNLKIKDIIEKLEEAKKNQQNNQKNLNLNETNKLLNAIQSINKLENFK